MGDSSTPAAMPSIDVAFALHRAGRLREAIAIYGRLLKENARQPAALHLLGLAFHQLGDPSRAEPLIRAAIGLEPRSPAYHSNHGMVLKALGRNAQAIESFRTAIRLSPAHADALANLGGTLPWLASEAEARRVLRRACVLAPAHEEALASAGAMERATGHARRAVALHRRALVCEPLRAVRYLNLGSSLLETDQGDQAQIALTRAALIDPGMAEVWNDHGYQKLVRLQVAMADACFRRAVTIRQGLATAWAGRAETAFVADDVPAALQYATRSVESDPANSHLRFRRGIFRLAAGDLEGGWADYDFLWRKPSAVKRVGAPPRWSGEPLAGKTLLVTADQGIGDELLFSCCIPDAVRDAKKVVLECDQRLVGLFRRSFPDVFVHAYDRHGTHANPLQRYDWIPAELTPDHMIEAGALMRCFRPSVAALDAAGKPWLVPDPARVEAMRKVVEGLGPGLKVGISWRSMRLTEARNVHYPGLLAVEPILRTPGVTFVCLQYGTGWAKELQATGFPITTIPGLDTTGDIEGVTALASLLDAVICPSSTLGWIGAAVGVPVWLMYNTPVFVEFGTDRLPGFPTVRSYRKTQPEPWPPLIARVVADLASWAAQPPAVG